MWNVSWRRQARRELRRLDGRLQERITRAIDQLAETNRGDIRRLVDPNLPAGYALRVGEWRILFDRDNGTQTLGPSIFFPVRAPMSRENWLWKQLISR